MKHFKKTYILEVTGMANTQYAGQSPLEHSIDEIVNVMADAICTGLGGKNEKVSCKVKKLDK